MVQSSRISKDKDGTKRIKIGFMSRSRNFRLLSRLMGALKKGPVAVALHNNRTLFYLFCRHRILFLPNEAILAVKSPQQDNRLCSKTMGTKPRSGPL